MPAASHRNTTPRRSGATLARRIAREYVSLAATSHNGPRLLLALKRSATAPGGSARNLAALHREVLVARHGASRAAEVEAEYVALARDVRRRGLAAVHRELRRTARARGVAAPRLETVRTMARQGGALALLAR